VITLFLTMLVGAGGNAGNQSAIQVIRGLATKEMEVRPRPHEVDAPHGHTRLDTLLSRQFLVERPGGADRNVLSGSHSVC
jgi:hypothetical protein